MEHQGKSRNPDDMLRDDTVMRRGSIMPETIAKNINRSNNRHTEQQEWLCVIMAVLFIMGVIFAGMVGNSKPTGNDLINKIYPRSEIGSPFDYKSVASFSELVVICKSKNAFDIDLLENSTIQARATIQDQLFSELQIEIPVPNSCATENLAFLYLALEGFSVKSNLFQLIQRYALTSFYLALGGEEWIRSTNWLTETTDECTWFGILCVGGRVAEIVLPRNNLNGVLPEGLCHLKFLAVLDVPNNKIAGPIYAHCLRKLSSLSTLLLQSNSLSGFLPEEIGGLPHLGVLNVANNSLVGSIPTSIGRLNSTLISLGLGDNRFEMFPSEIFELTKLEALNIDMLGPKIELNLPTEIGRLTNLVVLEAEETRLTGVLPSELGLLTRLTMLNLFDNNFHGDVPTELGLLRRLDFLDLSSPPSKESLFHIPWPKEVCDFADDFKHFYVPSGACSERQRLLRKRRRLSSI